ncbi:MAG TPA: inorganic phosphate transporter [Candidatus Limnocylindria bacterium]|nr:inorganic phosphate transporter [Candidatus Limnocylindria bacterium]
MLITFLFLAVCFLAYSNGANDNFKGVASLYGSRTCGYRTALAWGTIATFAGGLAAVFVAEALLKKFSGKGLVPNELTASPLFLLAVGYGAGATVLLATLFGFPISTTHALTGALVGAGLVATHGAGLQYSALGKSFVLPLLLSPALAVATGASIYLLFRFFRLRAGVTKQMCICTGVEERIVALPQPNGLFSAQSFSAITLSAAEQETCRQRYAGRALGFEAGKLLDALHFFSAGAVSFARGMNDTPKIAALLLIASAFDVRGALVAVAIAMAIGAFLSARKVAETMSQRITDMNPGQGFAANLSTALLVTTASYHGLPVSTTHVTVGSLLGMGIVTRQAKWAPVSKVLLSWVITLPCGAVFAALMYWLVRPAE